MEYNNITICSIKEGVNISEISSTISPFFIIRHRDEEIMSKYNLPSLLPRAGINLQRIRISSFCKICLRLLLDPNLVFSYDGEQISLPTLKHDYQAQALLFTEKAETLATNELIGKRLRYYRKLCGITGAEVASLWPKYAFCKITQSTISNHETARFHDIKLIDILAYINIYNSIIPLNHLNVPVLPGQITLDDILFGCKFSSIVKDVSPSESKGNAAQSNSNPDDPNLVEVNSEDNAILTSEIDSSDSSYPRTILRVLLTKMSEGICEYCGNPAPFRSRDNVPYLELHHIDKSKGDTLANTVVLCPNCNRKLSFLQDDQMTKVLQEKASHHTVSRLFEQHKL